MVSRQYQILMDIAKYRILTTQQAARCYGLQNRSVRRLFHELIRLGHIQMIPRIFPGMTGRPEHVYCLSAQGVELLRKEKWIDSDIPKQRILWDGRHGMEHQIALNWFLIESQELNHHANYQTDFLSQTSPFTPPGENQKCFLYSEGEWEGIPFQLIPDAVLTVQSVINMKSALFFLEIDRSTEALIGHPSRKNTILSKIKNYKYLYLSDLYRKYESVFDITCKGFRTLFVCDNDKRQSKIVQVAKQEQPANFIWVSTLDQILDNGISSSSWKYWDGKVVCQSSLFENK